MLVIKLIKQCLNVDLRPPITCNNVKLLNASRVIAHPKQCVPLFPLVPHLFPLFAPMFSKQTHLWGLWHLKRRLIVRIQQCILSLQLLILVTYQWLLTCPHYFLNGREEVM